MKKIFFLPFIISIGLLSSCTDTSRSKPTSFTNNHLDYWNDGKAEVSSYQLTQARYGELHKGTAVMVFVTEPFSLKSWTKADNFALENIPVLKLNFTKKFTTGIYPYSMMTSSFFPFEKGGSSFKISSSSQEWCGHTYMELLNKNDYDFQVNSYFQSEKSGKLSLKKSLLEDDVWSTIRLDPSALPEGTHHMIPSFFYIRLMHKELKSYESQASKSIVNDSTSNYNIHFPELDKTLSINYKTDFPHTIFSWEESYLSGFGNSAKILTTKGSLIKSIRTDYWTKHSNKNSDLRRILGLEK